MRKVIDKFSIREARKSDFNKIVDLMLEYDCYEYKLDKSVGHPSKKKIRKSELEHIRYGTKHFVIEEDNVIAGVLSMDIDLRGKEKIGVIHTFIITSSARKKGCGKKLAEYILDYMRKKGCKRVRSFVHYANKNAFSFWKKRGFDSSLGYGISRSLR